MKTKTSIINEINQYITGIYKFDGYREIELNKETYEELVKELVYANLYIEDSKKAVEELLNKEEFIFPGTHIKIKKNEMKTIKLMDDEGKKFIENLVKDNFYKQDIKEFITYDEQTQKIYVKITFDTEFFPDALEDMYLKNLNYR